MNSYIRKAIADFFTSTALGSPDSSFDSSFACLELITESTKKLRIQIEKCQYHHILINGLRL